METVDLLTDSELAELKRKLQWSATGTDLFGRIDAIRAQNAALTRRVERLTAALEKFANATLWLDIGTMKAIAAEALKEEP